MADGAGHRIAFHLIPGRQPAIVLDAGGGLDSSYWADLAPKLAQITGSEVISYDRAGLGESPEVPGPWNVTAARDDLAAVLKAANATGHVILVSHSLAGEVALYLVREHPAWFAGAVLVDANVPEFFTDEVIAAEQAAYAPVIAAAKAGPPNPQARQLLALSESFVETSRAFHTARWPASVPVTVIVSEETPFKGTPMAQVWSDAHASFAKAGPNRSLVIALKSSHDVAHDRPDVIIAAVRDMLGKAR
jgi:pimeloyl-ACP methyl ester carboxylesterase